MRTRSWILILLMIGAAAPATAQNRPSKQLSPGELLARVFVAERERIAWQAALDGDAETLGELLAADFVLLFDDDGAMFREDIMPWIDGMTDQDRVGVRVRDYRRIGDTQFVRYVLVALDGPEEAASQHLSTWMPRDGTWKIVNHQWLECDRSCRR